MSLRRQNVILLSIIFLLLLLISFTSTGSSSINVKDYIEGKFPAIFNIYLASLGELDEGEKEFIDLLEELSDEEKIVFARIVYEQGFAEDIAERVKVAVNRFEDEPEAPEEVLPPVPIDTGKWIYGKKLDPINDKTVISFTLENENIFETKKPVYLLLRYENGKTYVGIDWNHDMYSVYKGMINVTTRFGDKKASSLYWELYSGTKVIIVETIFGVQPQAPQQVTSLTRNKVKFIEKLLEVDTFAAKVKLTNRPAITAVFDVRGLENAINQYNDTLGWLKP